MIYQLKNIIKQLESQGDLRCCGNCVHYCHSEEGYYHECILGRNEPNKPKFRCEDWKISGILQELNRGKND